MQCDAVVLTSSALCERDLRCCARASTEELVGELMRHLGCALLTPAVLEQIVGAGETGPRRKPRLFALASLGLWTMDDYFLEFRRTVGWQLAVDLLQLREHFGDGVAHSLGRASADRKSGGNVVKRNPSRLGSQLSGQMKQPSGRFLPHRDLSLSTRVYRINRCCDKAFAGCL
jgi:hypothetical protein